MPEARRRLATRMHREESYVIFCGKWEQSMGQSKQGTRDARGAREARAKGRVLAEQPAPLRGPRCDAFEAKCQKTQIDDCDPVARAHT